MPWFSLGTVQIAHLFSVCKCHVCSEYSLNSAQTFNAIGLHLKAFDFYKQHYGDNLEIALNVCM